MSFVRAVTLVGLVLVLPTFAATTVAAPATIEESANATRRAVRVSPPDDRTQGPLPASARPVDTSDPDRVVGTGAAASCTSRAVVDAVAVNAALKFFG